MKWKDIYERAIGKGFNEPELKAKDEARGQIRDVVLSAGMTDPESAECPEDAIEEYCEMLDAEFDERGNIISLTEKEWEIPATWEVTSILKVRAKDLGGALRYMTDNISKIPPAKEYFVDGSYRLMSYKVTFDDPDGPFWDGPFEEVEIEKANKKGEKK